MKSSGKLIRQGQRLFTHNKHMASQTIEIYRTNQGYYSTDQNFDSSSLYNKAKGKWNDKKRKLFDSFVGDYLKETLAEHGRNYEQKQASIEQVLKQLKIEVDKQHGVLTSCMNQHQHFKQVTNGSKSNDKQEEKKTDGNSQNANTGNDRDPFALLGWLVAILSGTLTIYTAAKYLLPKQIRQLDKWVEKMAGWGASHKKHNIMPDPRNYDAFIERPETINKIEAIFNETADLHAIAEVLIVGVEGSGKSELAEEYADKYAKAIAAKYPDDEQTVKIFHAENPESLFEQYRVFANELGIQTQDKLPQAIINEVHAELSHRDHWLLMFDNIDNIDNINSQQTYQSIKQYIPQHSMSRGRVLLTARQPSILSESKLLTVAVVNVNHPAYQLTKNEINSLIDKVIGQAHADYGNHRELKLHLARSLGNLPQAIKKAACYIAASNSDKNTIEKYMAWVRKEALQLKEHEYPEVNQPGKAKKINQIVNELSIKAIAKNEVVASILSFVFLLNPDSIQFDLLKERFIKKDNKANADFDNYSWESFLSAIELLKKYALLEEKDNQLFKLHRSLIDAIPESLAKESVNNKAEQFRQQQLSLILRFFQKDFNRDNTSETGRTKNGLFAAHIETLAAHNRKLKLQQPELYYFRVATACHYMMTGRSIQARQTLNSNRIELEASAKLKVIIDSLDKAEINSLDEPQFVQLVIYAQTLYHLGRTYFDIGDFAVEPSCKAYLDKAVRVRKVIDDITAKNVSLKKLDSLYNEFDMDSILVKRNGTYEYQRRVETDTKKLAKLADAYNKLKEAKKDDLKNVKSCAMERFRVQQKIAVTTSDENERKRICDEALNECYETLLASNQSVKDIRTNHIDNSKLLSALLDTRDTRQAKYVNDIANLLLIRGDKFEAKRYFLESVLLEKGKATSELADAYVGIAKTEVLDKPELARIAVNLALYIQHNVLRLNSNNPSVNDAELIAQYLKEKEQENHYELGLRHFL